MSLEAEEERERIEQRGAVDNIDVQETVKHVLEGGKEALNAAGEEYGF